MGRTATGFYVAYFESLILSVCGFFLLSGLLRESNNYSSLQWWAVDTQFIFFGFTLVLQLLLSGIVKEDVGGMSSLLASAANAYCSLCFMIFLVFVLMFSQSTVASDSVRNFATSPHCVWNFHPANMQDSNCTNGTWRETAFIITSSTPSNGIKCLHSTTRLYRDLHQFSSISTNGTWYFQSERSNAVQMVFGNSYAASSDQHLITAQPIAGSISFALVWAFMSVTLLVACYAAYSSTVVGQYCPLFLSPRCVCVCVCATTAEGY